MRGQDVVQVIQDGGGQARPHERQGHDLAPRRGRAARGALVWSSAPYQIDAEDVSLRRLD